MNDTLLILSLNLGLTDEIVKLHTVLTYSADNCVTKNQQRFLDVMG